VSLRLAGVFGFLQMTLLSIAQVCLPLAYANCSTEMQWKET